jgi:hypothetical protein
MKIPTTIKWAAAMAAVCLAAHAASAQNQIGVNFVANDNPDPPGEMTPGGVINDAVDSLATNETAGVFPQTNWNNLGRFGDSITLNDSYGTPSQVVIAWNSPGMWHCDGQPGYPLLTNGNAKLMDGFLESTWSYFGPNVPIPSGRSIYNIAKTDQPIVLLSGLNQFVQSHCGDTYSIVIYVNNDTASGRHSEYWVDAASGPYSAITDGAILTPQLYVVDGAQFGGTFTRVSPLAINDASAFDGNYIEFDGLTNDEVLIRTQNIQVPGGPSVAINGIQVIASRSPLPPVEGIPTISPTNVIFPGSTVTISDMSGVCGPLFYQWRTDGGGGGSLTNIPGAAGSASNFGEMFTLVTTPTTVGTWKYDVVLTNSYGSVTSLLATVTVLPAPTPMLTTDITNGLFTLTWIGGGLLEATNVSGPWVTNPAVSPFTFAPTGSMKFYRIYNPDFKF